MTYKFKNIIIRKLNQSIEFALSSKNLKPNFSHVNQSLVFSGNNILLQGNNLNLDNQDNISLILVVQPQIQNSEIRNYFSIVTFLVN